MSLETEIATLREAVIKLTQTLKGQSFVPSENEHEAAKEAQTKPQDDVAETKPTEVADDDAGGMVPTRKELTDIALSISRASKGAKPKIKAILDEHGAATITKLGDEHLYAVWEKLEALRGEVVS